MKKIILNKPGSQNESFARFRRYAKLHQRPIVILTLVYIGSTVVLVLAPHTLSLFQVAYCTQRAQLIHGTIRDNVTLFSERYTDEDIWEAAGMLGLSDWFRDFPNGLGTHLEMGEANLSSGEAQLIALVRLFLRRPGWYYWMK
jgi:ABC-type bacteriocin/lantibiotic exporter with double-glycine peptidase domain